MRKNGLEELILTENIDGKRSRGRQREKYLTKPKQMGGRAAPKERRIK